MDKCNTEDWVHHEIRDFYTIRQCNVYVNLYSMEKMNVN